MNATIANRDAMAGFSARTGSAAVSHQRVSQLKAVANGICAQCFSAPMFKSERCKKCYTKFRAYSLQHSRTPEALARIKLWNESNREYKRNHAAAKRARLKQGEPPNK